MCVRGSRDIEGCDGAVGGSDVSMIFSVPIDVPSRDGTHAIDAKAIRRLHCSGSIKDGDRPIRCTDKAVNDKIRVFVVTRNDAIVVYTSGRSEEHTSELQSHSFI